jgi:hypothetical protein
MTRALEAAIVRLLFFVALVGLGCTHCHRQASPPADKPVTLVFTTGLVGHLEPCGCSPDQRGGVARAAAAVDQIRKEGRPVLLVDGGDRFFEKAEPTADPLAAAQQERQARTMAEVTRLMGYDALVRGARDARADAQLLSGKDFPTVLDTGNNAASFTKPALLKDVGGVKVGLFAVGTQPNAAQLIESRAAGLKSQGAQLIVLVAYRTLDEAKQLLDAAKKSGVSLVLAGRADVPETHESAAFPDSEPPLFTVQARGEAILRIDLLAGGERGANFVKVAGQGERDAEMEALQARIENYRRDVTALAPTDPLAKMKTDKLLELEGRKAKLAAAPPAAMPKGQNAFTYAFVPMSPSLPDSPPVRAAINQYDAAVAKENLAYAKSHPKACPTPAKDAAVYVGQETCASCHEDAQAFWTKTAHAHAYSTLAQKNKQFNVSCVGCHVTGYEKAGGACDIAQTEGRQNVQCESCHGPGSLHAESGDPTQIRLQVPESQCRTCHDPENSPHFNYATYRPQILGPGHMARK